MDSRKVFYIFLVICAASLVESIPFTIDVLENRDIIFPRRSDLVKRTANNDASEFTQQKVSLASFVENIETGIIHTALSVDPLASDSHAEVQNLSTTTPHPVEKRSTVEENNTAAVESSTPLVLVQTTEKIPAVDSVPSHVVIHRVSVFKAPDVGSGLFPTFLVQDVSGDATEVTIEAEDDEDESSSKNDSDSSESEESTESNESSDSSKEKPTEVKGTSTTAKESSSSKASSSSTTPLPVDEKKNVEKELKEKVVEVEADPVIFTARV